MSRRLPAWVLMLGLLPLSASAQTQPGAPGIVLAVAPFTASEQGQTALARQVSAVLSLQAWQTLRRPGSPEGRAIQGSVTWDLGTAPPISFEQAAQYADPRALVLWGRAWRYGTGYVIESFLFIGSGRDEKAFGSDLWTVDLAGKKLSVGIPRREVEFEPIVLKEAVMSELSDASGIKVYSAPGGRTKLIGRLGSSFQALEAGPQGVKVRLPDGAQGWVRLPELAQERPEVVDYTGAVVRLLRSDWPGATGLLERVVNNPNASTAVKVDACLYLAIAAARSQGDPLPWIHKAYELNPYSRSVLQYLCMEMLWRGHLQKLQQLLAAGRPLYSSKDAWFGEIGTYLATAGVSAAPR